MFFTIQGFSKVTGELKNLHTFFLYTQYIKCTFSAEYLLILLPFTKKNSYGS